MERHLTSGLRGTVTIIFLLSLALAATLALGGTGKVLAGSTRDGPPGSPSALLPALVDTGAHDATLSRLSLTGDESPIPLSPEFNPETTFYTTTAEADRVLVEAETAKDTATIAAFAVDDKTVVPEMDEDKLTTRIQILEGAVTDFSMTVKAGDGATFETYHVLFARSSTQNLPEITIQASRSEYVAGIGLLKFTVTRTGDTSSDLDLTVNFAQDRDWLSTTSRDITIPAGQSEAQFWFIPAAFSSEVTQSGDLTATVAPVTGYDTSGAMARVRVISQEGPAVTVFFEESEFQVEEGAGELAAILVARAAPGVPHSGEIHVAVSTISMGASSRLTDGMPTGDYLALSEEITFAPADFAEEDGSLVGRVAVIVTILDDDVYEGDEQFGLRLQGLPGNTEEVGLVGPDGGACVYLCDDHLVTIKDNDEEPGLRLLVSSDRINESGATTSTIDISTNNGNSFPSDQTITVNFGGPAVYGDDYTVIPADTDDGIAGHQVVLKAGTVMTTLAVTAVDDGADDSCEWIGVSATVGEDSTAIPGTGLITLLDDDEGSPDTIAALTVGLSGILTGSLTAADEGRDWYSFEATGGTSYIIEVKHPLTFSSTQGSFGNPSQIPGYLADPSILEVIDDMDVQMLGEHGQGGFTLNFARAFFTPEDDGTYYIKVGAGAQDPTGLGCYTISVRVDDHADDYRTQSGAAVRPGESTTATIDSDVAYDDSGMNWWDWNSNPNPNPGDEPDDRLVPRRGIESLDDRDVFRYEIAEEGTYRLSLADQPAGVGFWYIWNSDGNLWLRATEDPVEIIQWHHEPGTYYAEVGTPYDSEGNTGTYTFSVIEVTDGEAVGRSTGPVDFQLAEDEFQEGLGGY